MSLSEWNFDVAARHVRSKVVLPEPLARWDGASIDTRTLKTGEVFFALRGRNRDGHDCLHEAFRKGASGAVIREDYMRNERESIFRERSLFHNLIPVAKPEEALGVLSAHYRGLFSAVPVAITGSVGKTSVKEFTRFLLSQKYPILATSGNLNNHLGLPLTLFRLKPEHQYCVAELGANHKGEIRKLASFLKPRVGVITGVSPAHLEGFGNLDGIYEAKLELASSLTREKGTLVLPDRDPELIGRARRRKIPILLFGRERTSDFHLTGAEARDGWVQFEVNQRWSFRFPGYAAFQAENALAALAACFACGVLPSHLPAVWNDVEFPHGRFEVILSGDGITLVDDCYNANPHSCERALDAFEALGSGGRRILVLGDMLELGGESTFHHRTLGEKIVSRGFQALLATGEAMKETVLACERAGNPPLALHFEDKAMLSHFLTSFLRSGDQVLFKASRGIQLEEVIRALSVPLSLTGTQPRL